jgi:Fe-S oxidoreductase
MDLCVSCKGCKRECENEVDMALLKAEYLAQRLQLQKPPLRTVLWAGLPRLLTHSHWLKKLVQLRNGSELIAKLLEKTLKVTAKQPLPVLAEKSFLQTAQSQPIESQHSEKSPVVLFVDTFNNYFNPEVADAAVKVLQAAGYAVKIAQPSAEQAEPERPLCCGRTYFSNGMIDKARFEAQRLLTVLLPEVEAGAVIIGLEPSCILSLRDEYLTLGLGEGAKKLAANVLLLEEFIAKEHTAKRWQLEFKAWQQTEKLLVHGHCHQKAVGAMKAMRKVLRLIPQLDFEILDTSCCGMAGHFGYEAEHYQASQQMAELALYPALRAQANAKVLANGFSCQQQIQHCDNQPKPLHIAQLLAAAVV